MNIIYNSCAFFGIPTICKTGVSHDGSLVQVYNNFKPTSYIRNFDMKRSMLACWLIVIAVSKMPATLTAIKISILELN